MHTCWRWWPGWHCGPHRISWPRQRWADLLLPSNKLDCAISSPGGERRRETESEEGVTGNKNERKTEGRVAERKWEKNMDLEGKWEEEMKEEEGEKTFALQSIHLSSSPGPLPHCSSPPLVLHHSFFLHYLQEVDDATCLQTCSLLKL